MKIIYCLLLLISQAIAAQQSIAFKIINDDTHQILPGVTVSVEKLKKVSVTDSNGIVLFQNLPDGKYVVDFSHTGYKTREFVFIVPYSDKDTVVVGLEPYPELLQEVVVSSTRLNQTIKNTPVHIDVIGQEDIEEGTAMSPGNIKELLSELSGTQVQQTSAVSGNVTIRLQGLDGRYTQLLKDGFPLYGGFSGSLSIMQTPPLDLKQVEVIKGAGSALYGGDAIAGIINLITKKPDTIMHADAIINQTAKGGTDLSGFYSKKNLNTGITLMVTASHQQPFDVNEDGFTDLPHIRQISISPDFFWYPDDSTTLRLGINISAEQRTGGDVQAVEHGADSLHPFLEKSHTDRDYYQLSYVRKLLKQQTLTLKNTIGYFYRNLTLAGQPFSGTQLSSFTEASYLVKHSIHQDVVGLNIITDKFMPQKNQQGLRYTYNTVGLFAQDDWTLSNKTTLETGIRTDLSHTVYFLPRAALIYKASSQFTMRLGGGMAYKLPTIFNALTEEEGYQKLYPITSAKKAERSASGNLALNYHGYIGDDIHFSIDQNFYYTHLTNALIPREDSLQAGWLYYINASRPVNSKGFETNSKFSKDDWSLSFSYTFTDARRLYEPDNTQLPLTPQSRFVSTLMYENESSWRAGIEAFFTGEQYLDNGTRTKSFWTFDAMAEKQFGHFSILLNVENFTDTRQSRFGPLYTGSSQNPVFKEIYAPVEGIVGNVALRFSL